MLEAMPDLVPQPASSSIDQYDHHQQEEIELCCPQHNTSMGVSKLQVDPASQPKSMMFSVKLKCDMEFGAKVPAVQGAKNFQDCREHCFWFLGSKFPRLRCSRVPKCLQPKDSSKFQVSPLGAERSFQDSSAPNFQGYQGSRVPKLIGFQNLKVSRFQT